MVVPHEGRFVKHDYATRTVTQRKAGCANDAPEYGPEGSFRPRALAGTRQGARVAPATGWAGTVGRHTTAQDSSGCAAVAVVPWPPPTPPVPRDRASPS